MPAKKITKKTVAEETTVKEAIAPPKENKEKTEVKPIRKKFNKEDLIPCRSVTVGELICASPKNKDFFYRWSNYGDYCEVEYQDLLALNSKKSAFIYMPTFIIEDSDLMKEWRLESLYNEFYGLDDPEALFKMKPEEILKRLNNAPAGLQEMIKSVAAKCVKDGTLDSVSTIKAIDESLGTQLIDFIK